MNYTHIENNEQFVAAANSDQLVCFDCTISSYYMQHLLMGGFDENMKILSHLYIAPAKSLGILEILAYYKESMNLDSDALRGKQLRVYGTLRSQNSDVHTEYGLFLDKLEVLE